MRLSPLISLPVIAMGCLIAGAYVNFQNTGSGIDSVAAQIVGPGTPTVEASATPDQRQTDTSWLQTQAASVSTIEAVRETAMWVNATGTAVALAPLATSSAHQTEVAAEMTMTWLEAEAASNTNHTTRILSTRTAEAVATQRQAPTATAAASATAWAEYIAPLTATPGAALTATRVANALAVETTLTAASNGGLALLLCIWPLLIAWAGYRLINAVSWRVQGSDGGAAEAQVRGSEPAFEPEPEDQAPPRQDPVKRNQPDPLNRYTPTEETVVKFLTAGIPIVGAGAMRLPAVSEFSDHTLRSMAVRALREAGLARTEDGVGVHLTLYPIKELRDKILSGQVKLSGPLPGSEARQ